MYVVTIKNNGVQTVIHGDREKLKSGSVVKGINSIDSLTFSILPSNVGFNFIRSYSTLIDVFNINRNRYEFIGRVLYPEDKMEESGLITKDVTCESIFGYLCDSQQAYVAEKNWTVRGLLQHMINRHNSQVEEYKRFTLGTVTATDANNNLYVGISRENTWDSIKSNLLDKIGGEIRYRVENGVNYIDYMDEIGETKETAIELSVNMKSITRNQDPTEFITRLIPLGAKVKDDGEERLDITSVNGGLDYIDDEEAIAAYGIHVGYMEWDDVTTAKALLSKGRAWLTDNNKVKVKYSITALELSLIGLAFDDFDVYNYHPIVNALLGIDDTARIIKKTIDICEEIKSTIDVGDNFKALSDIQREQAAKLASNLQSNVGSVKALDQKLTATNSAVANVAQNKYDAVKLTSDSYVEFGHNELMEGASIAFDWSKYLLLIFSLGNRLTDADSGAILSAVNTCHVLPTTEFASTSETYQHTLRWNETECSIYQDGAGGVYAKAVSTDSDVFLRVFGIIEK